jgi:hypothetical protein
LLIEVVAEEKSKKNKRPPEISQTKFLMCKKLVEKYHKDLAAMARDTKINKWQYTTTQLKKIFIIYKEQKKRNKTNLKNKE